MRKDKYWTACGAFVSAVASALLLIGLVDGGEKRSYRTKRGVVGIASWYSTKECTTKRNPKCLMANGRPLDDNALTCASWFYTFNTKLRVWHRGRSVVVTVTDRGPARRLVKKGRIIDLTRAAFAKLAPLKRGLIQVTVEEVKK